MGDNANGELTQQYGPVGPLPTVSHVRGGPRPPASIPQGCQPHASVPIPKAAPPHADSRRRSPQPAAEPAQPSQAAQPCRAAEPPSNRRRRRPNRPRRKQPRRPRHPRRSKQSPPRHRSSRRRKCRRCRGWSKALKIARRILALAGTGRRRRYSVRPAAAKIRSAISLGWDTRDRWPASSSTVVAFMRLARNRSRSGLMV